MYTDANIEIIQQTLQLARQRLKLDPQNTTETITYIAHVEHLLLELENAVMMNQLQARNIRTYVRQLHHNGPSPTVENTEVAYP